MLMPSAFDVSWMFKGVRALVKGLGAGALAACVFWWVAECAEPASGTVFIHVVEANVEVRVGGFCWHLDAKTDEPIECTLSAGSHTLEMWRGSELLSSEPFTLKGGEERVLTAWRDPRSNLAENHSTLTSPDEPARR